MSGDLTPCTEYAQSTVPRRRNTNTGKYDEVYSDEDIIDLLTRTRMATREVADELDCHRTTAHSKLRDLEDEGEVVSTEAGNTLIWEIAE